MRALVGPAVIFGLALWALAPATSLADAPRPFEDFAKEERETARRMLDERVRDCMEQEGRNFAHRCRRIYPRLALLDKPGGALEALARKRFLEGVGGHRHYLTWLFERVGPKEKVLILDEFREHWPIMGRGESASRRAMLVNGLWSEHAAVRHAALRLAATRPFARIGHEVADLAHEHPELLQPALLAVGASGDKRLSRWVVEQLAHDDPEVRAAAMSTIERLGPLATMSHLKLLAAEGESKVRDRAVAAIARFGLADHLSTLYAWIDERGEENPELKERIVRTVAEIESGLFERPRRRVPKPRLPE
jgi:hypothetical protein